MDEEQYGANGDGGLFADAQNTLPEADETDDAYIEDDADYEEGDEGDDNDPVETPQAQARELTPQAADSPSYVPFQASDNPYLNAIAEDYPELAQQIAGAIQHSLSQSYTAQGYSQTFQEQVTAAAPEWAKKHATVMRAAEGMLPPQAQGRASTKVFAFAAPAMEYADRTGDVAGAIRMLQQSGGGGRQAQTPRTLVAPPRTPTPGAGGGNVPPPARQAEAKGTRAAGSRASRFLQGLGFEADEARKIAREL